jgi:hypothetical protein
MHHRCKVGDCVLHNFNFLKKLAKTQSAKKRNNLIKYANPDEMQALVEIAHNIVHSKFKLTPAKTKKLTPYATPIRELSRARTVNTVKRVLQNGNGIPLASLLLPVLLAVGQKLLE